MKVEVLSTSGYAQALYGLGLSYGKTKKIPYVKFEYALACLEAGTPELANQDDVQVAKEMLARATINAPCGLGHNKFLESIDVHFLITAPRFWWQEMDTYRLATKQSDSTMHTLMNESKCARDILQALQDSTYIPFNEDFDSIKDYNDCIDELNSIYTKYAIFCESVHGKKLSKTTKKLFIKHPLPETFSNMRQEELKYSALRNIYHQRKNHELPHWHVFCDVIKTLPHSEWITSDMVSGV